MPDLLQLAAAGDQRALGEIFEMSRDRLRRTVKLRLDSRLCGRLDPSDILQDAFLDAARRLPEYAETPRVPLFVWLRSLTLQRLVDLHRRHLGAKMRDAGAEISLDDNGVPQASAASLTDLLIDPAKSPDSEIVLREVRRQVHMALENMDRLDREVLAMRHFEMLSNNEIAQALEISATAASNRYVRAVQRLKQVLSSMDDARN